MGILKQGNDQLWKILLSTFGQLSDNVYFILLLITTVYALATYWIIRKTKRKAACIFIMIAVDFIFYSTIWKSFHLSSDFLIYGVIFLDVPIAMFGWLEPMGMPLENYLKKILIRTFIAPTKRTEKTNIYRMKSTRNAKEEPKNKKERKKKKKESDKLLKTNPDYKPFK